MTPQQLAEEPTNDQKKNDLIQKETLKAHLEARQRSDLRRDLAKRLQPSDGPFIQAKQSGTGKETRPKFAVASGLHQEW